MSDPEVFETWCRAWAIGLLRVLKPGGHLAAFGGSRTWHRMARGVESAGFQIRDQIAWLYSSGMPKSMDLSRAADQASAMVEEFVAGATKKSLSAKYAVHTQTVSAHVRKVGAMRPEKVTDEVLADFAAGVATADLAERCGVTPDTILRYARLAGVQASHQLQQAEIEKIVDLYAQGVKIIEIGRRFGIGNQHARRVLDGAGVVIRPRGRRPMLADRQGEVMGLRSQGWSYARIADRVGVNATTVREYVLRWTT